MIVRGDNGYVLYSLEPLDVKHMPGKHDQRTHGRRYAKVGGRNATEGYVASATGDYPGFKTAKEAVAYMKNKHPHITFAFSAKADIGAVNETLREADRLLTHFPNVSRDMRYVGDASGGDSPQEFKNILKKKGFQHCGAFCAKRWDSATGSYVSSIVMNPKTMQYSPEATKKYHDKLQLDSYNPKDTSKRFNVAYSHESIFAHEFGHAVHNHLQNFKDPGKLNIVDHYTTGGKTSRVQDMVDNWSAAHRGRGDKVSVYAATNHKENFAEGFLALTKLPPKQWPQFAWEQKRLLDLFFSGNPKERLTLYSTTSPATGLTAKEQKRIQKKVDAVYKHLGITSSSKGVANMAEERKGGTPEPTNGGASDGFSKFPESGDYYVESTPIGGDALENWLKTTDYKPTPGGLSQEEVGKLQADEAASLQELLNELSDKNN